jgi:hypothetical protein
MPAGDERKVSGKRPTSPDFRNGLNTPTCGVITRAPSMHPHPPRREGFWYTLAVDVQRDFRRSLSKRRFPPLKIHTLQAFPGGRIPVCC